MKTSSQDHVKDPLGKLPGSLVELVVVRETDGDGLTRRQPRSVSLAPDPRREMAQKAAKARWAEWAAKKVV
jgi:hypothetical protein